MSSTAAYSGRLIINNFGHLSGQKKIEIIDRDSGPQKIEVQSVSRAHFTLLLKSLPLWLKKFNNKYIYKSAAIILLVCSAAILVISRPNILKSLNISLVATPKPVPVKLVIPPLSEAVKTHSLLPVITKIKNQTITIDFGPTVVTPSPSDISKWLYSKATPLHTTAILSIDKTALTSYVDGLIKQHSTTPVNQISVTHPDGSSVVLAKGSDGVQYSGPDSIVSSISGNLLSGNGNNITVPGVLTPFKVTDSTQYSALLEVDVSAKRMYAYQNGNLIRTFLVTAGAPATPTPLGTFKIWSQVKEEDMRGYNPDGSKYFQPNVQWINYFDHSGDAIHANYWRPPSYFGSVNSSHGCVGLDTSDALWVYNWASVGTTVIIHS